jgi:RecJ-like exonuclease
VHKTLEYSFDPLIPGVTGSESGAAQFLAELGIPLNENGAWRRLCDLTFDEEKKLATAIIVERLKFRHKDAADVFGDVYTFIGWPEELQDAREFATLLNACGRLGEPEVGLRLCLGDMAALDDSWRVMGDYKKVISDGVNWLRDGCLQEGRGVERREGAAYILGGGRIPESVIGTVVSIALSSNIIGEEKPLVGFADAGDGAGGEYVKVSARIPRNLNLNLRNIISGAARAVGGEGGGHQFAAGGLIPRGKEKEFIDETEKILNGLLRDGAGRARQTS